MCPGRSSPLILCSLTLLFKCLKLLKIAERLDCLHTTLICDCKHRMNSTCRIHLCAKLKLEVCWHTKRHALTNSLFYIHFHVLVRWSNCKITFWVPQIRSADNDIAPLSHCTNEARILSVWRLLDVKVYLAILAFSAIRNTCELLAYLQGPTCSKNIMILYFVIYLKLLRYRSHNADSVCLLLTGAWKSFHEKLILTSAIVKLSNFVHCLI